MLNPKILLIVTFVLASLQPLPVFAAEQPAQTSEQITQLDINSADAETIASVLIDVGMVKAREIVAYREMFGNFTSIDELAEVQGIGPATIERNRDRILVVND